MKESRFIHLDMVRGMAALLVCAQHLRHVEFIDYHTLPARLPFQDKFFYFLTAQGHNAVMIFFVLSGFFVAGSVAKDFERGSWSWKRFAVRRLSRLYVVLIPALVLTWFWDNASLLFAPDVHLGNHSIALFGASLLFLQWIFTPQFGINSPLWSVAYEFWYYLMFPLLFVTVSPSVVKSRRIVHAVLFLVCFLLLPPVVLRGGIAWLMGYFAFVLFTSRKFSSYATGAATLLAGTALLLLSEYLSLTNPEYGETPINAITFRDLLTALSFALMVPYLAKHQPLFRLYHIVAIGLSNISYTLYAVHFPFLSFLCYTLIREKTEIPSVTSYALFIAYFALILVYATLVWWLFEYRTDVVRRFAERKLCSN